MNTDHDSQRAALQQRARQKLSEQGVSPRDPLAIASDRLWWIALWLAITATIAMAWSAYAVYALANIPSLPLALGALPTPEPVRPEIEARLLAAAGRERATGARVAGT